MDNRLALGILETARAIGADPLDLATAISYETAGTFDPTKRGPTTQWGQHRGLIQFGEPQARQHGVDWNDPIGSQLGPNGAVASYFRSSGFKPGMSGLDLYSTINAGAPGRYKASDANNGGAPGDVRDKWENQMGGHRAKAGALMAQVLGERGSVGAVNAMAGGSPLVDAIGSRGTPTVGDNGGRAFQAPTAPPPVQAAMPMPEAPDLDRSDRVANAMLASAMNGGPVSHPLEVAGRTLSSFLAGRIDRNNDRKREAYRDEANDVAGVMAQREADAANQRAAYDHSWKVAQFNQTAANQATDNARADRSLALQEAAAARAAQPQPVAPKLTTVYTEDGREQKAHVYPDGRVEPVGGVKAAGAAPSTNVTVNTGSEVGTIPQGYELFTDPDTGGRSMRPIEGGPAAMEVEKDERAAGVKADTAERYANVVVQDIDRAIGKITDGGLPATGFLGGQLSRMPGTDAFGVAKLMETVRANAGFDRLQAMRDSSPTGGALGAVTERELTFLQAAIGNLDQAQSEEDVLFNLQRVRAIYDDIANVGGIARGEGVSVPGGAPTPSAPAAPASGLTEAGVQAQSSALLDQARNAIARGAPREAVMERLRSMGVGVEGL